MIADSAVEETVTEDALQTDNPVPNDNIISSEENQDEVGDVIQPVSTIPSDKIKIHFIPVGNAPIMKRTKFLVSRTETFASLQTRLRKLIIQPVSNITAPVNISSSTPSLFMYLHTCFVPSLEDTIGQLFDLYHTSQELKVHYSLQEAWG